MCGGEPWPFEKIDLRCDGENDCREEESEDEIGEWADETEAFPDGRRGCPLRGIGRSVLLQAAGGQKEDAAQLEVVPCGGEGASDLTNDDSEKQQRPQSKASGTRGSGDGRVADREAQQQKEEGVDAYFHAEESAYRKGPCPHAYHCMRWLRGQGEMRVIAGKFRSRVLSAPKGMTTRPTSDRLRETLFNVIATRLEEVRFVDLYAGSGAVGIEAISRGASFVWFAEDAPVAAKAIRENLATLKISSGYSVEERSAAALLERLIKRNESVDLIFLDPPYEAEAEYVRTLELLGSARGRALLAEDARVIVEHRAKYQLQERYGGLERVRVLKQGDAALSFFAVAPEG